jgi:hypothetical protein
METDSMGELDVVKLRGIVANCSDDKTAYEVVQYVREKHARELAKVSDYLIDQSLAAMVERTRRRRASVVLNDGFDLFGEFSVKRQRLIETTDSFGKTIRKNKNVRDVTIGQMREEIQRLERRTLPEHKELSDLKRMVEKAEKFGDDNTTFGEALTRAHSEG